MRKIIQTLQANKNLTDISAKQAFDIIMSGKATKDEISDFLIALTNKGETVLEIRAAVDILRSKALKINAPENAIDVCGTGGDGANLLNISTAVGFVLAGCGVKVAKHGNKAISSKSGSADVLQKLGVNINSSVQVVENALQEAGICFLSAPLYHSAMKHVAPVRQKLKMRTIFNILGPLINPASVKYQLVGVYDKNLMRKYAEVLKILNTKKAWVVHSKDGLDEISIATETDVIQVKNGVITEFTITPEDFGLQPIALENLKGGDAEFNAAAMQYLLDGKKSAYRDMVILNSAAALIVAGKVDDYKKAVRLAVESIDSGKAKTSLENLINITNQ
jgi:anthranilate phosphoribosyltransferase